MSTVSNKHVVLGVSGGIAAYKSAELVRRLQERGCQVRVVMTAAAREFVTPLTMQALSGYPTHCDLLDESAEAAMGHIELARWADVVVIAPATADIMAKLAHGLADDLLTTLCLATTAPIVLAPAMNQQMWSAPATQVNLRLLLERGIKQIGPVDGLQACGECGPGRMLEPDQIAGQVTTLFANGRLNDLSLLVTAGPTREAIDPVRFISNHSSGKMGYAIARAGVEAGANVTLVSGPSNLSSPVGVERISVVSAKEMHTEVMSRASEADIFIGAAAVADYRLEKPSELKLKKNASRLDISLVRTPDILADVAALANAPFTAGFAAETNDVERNARDKLSRKALDLIVANQVGVPGTGFDGDENVVTLYWEGGEKALARAPKLSIARMLIDSIAERYHEKRAVKDS